MQREFLIVSVSESSLTLNKCSDSAELVIHTS